MAFVYDGDGRQTSIRDRRGLATQYELDARGNRARTRYADGTTETATHDANGNRTSLTDRLGQTFLYAYDALNRPIQITHPGGSITRTEYDALGRVTATIDEAGGRTEFAYDTAGRRTKIVDALGGQTLFTYDSRGNMTGVTDANGHTRTLEYDGNRHVTRLTLPDGTSLRLTYDTTGAKTAVTDQHGNVTRFDYDAAGRLTRVINALGGQTLYGYDEAGNRVSVTDANGHVTRWAYDSRHQVVRHTLPLGMSETFTYDDGGNVASRTDYLGRTTTYAYDVNGRLATKTYPDAGKITYAYAADGRVTTVRDSRGDTVYSYDVRRRPVQVTDPGGASIRYGYDSRGNRVSVESASGTSAYAYDALGRLTSVTDAGDGTTRYAYDAVGNRIRGDHPNGTRTEYAYDANNRLVTLRHLRSDGSTLASFTYTVGVGGERVSVTEDSGRRVDYTYDALYRLVREGITDPVAGNETFQYTYDAAGNRLSMTSSRGTQVYAYDANDRLLSVDGTIYAYDANGNTVSIGSGAAVSTLTYDFDDRLVGVVSPTSSATFAYDASGVRVGSTISGVVTTYLVDRIASVSRVLEERDGAGALRVRYEYGLDLLSQWRSGVPSYYLADGLGSTRALTDGGGAVTATYTYDAFGVLLGTSGSTSNRYRFTGEESDGPTAPYYLRARYYDPATGRFLTTDPLEDAIGDPSTLHRYLYCDEFLLDCTDPTGRSNLIEQMTVVSVIGFLASSTVAVLTVEEVLYYLAGSHAFVPLTAPDAVLMGIGGSVSASKLIERIPHPIAKEVALGLSFVYGVGGVELVLGPGADLWLFGYLGGSYSIGQTRPGRRTFISNTPDRNPWWDVTAYIGSAWNTKTTSDYEGEFLSVSGTRLLSKFPTLPPNATIFTGPKIDAAYGFSVNFFDVVGALRSPLRPQTGFNLSAARTYYLLLKNFGGFPPEPAPCHCGLPVAGPRG